MTFPTLAELPPELASVWRPGATLAEDRFTAPLSGWSAELESGGTVRGGDGRLVIDVPAGCTVWLERPLTAPLLIRFEVTVLDRGGPNDRVSDLNCFWMARDARSPDDLFATRRAGRFADYNQLRAYYVGLGGNRNTTTRLRRYVGDPEHRPLHPEHDLRDPRFLITPNRPQTIALVATDDGLVQYYRDGEKYFELRDSDPYTDGWFGLRTTHNRMAIERFAAYRLERI